MILAPYFGHIEFISKIYCIAVKYSPPPPRPHTQRPTAATLLKHKFVRGITKCAQLKKLLVAQRAVLEMSDSSDSGSSFSEE
jgi:hypothetical protein